LLPSKRRARRGSSKSLSARPRALPIWEQRDDRSAGQIDRGGRAKVRDQIRARSAQAMKRRGRTTNRNSGRFSAGRAKGSSSETREEGGHKWRPSGLLERRSVGGCPGRFFETRWAYLHSRALINFRIALPLQRALSPSHQLDSPVADQWGLYSSTFHLSRATRKSDNAGKCPAGKVLLYEGVQCATARSKLRWVDHRTDCSLSVCLLA
jgi:hypothetical protein